MLPYHSRTWFAAVAALVATAAHPACNTNAVGIEECRRIEYARCDAAVHCPRQFDVDNAQECRLFYRDHCLHGLAASASATEVKVCVNAIEQLSTCAKEGGSKLQVAVCGVRVSDPKLATVCDALAAPAAIEACSFLGEVPTVSTGGQAGATQTSATGASVTGGTSATDSGAGGIPGLESFGIGGLDLSAIGGLSL